MPNKKQPPSNKKKLITLHLDGKLMNVGMAEFLHEVMFAVGNRSAGDLEVKQEGAPTVHVNAAGDVVIYVTDWTV
jgi:hypothetical protein